MELQAGRELDALVAEKVMGWRRLPEPYTFRHQIAEELTESVTWTHADDIRHVPVEVPHFSTDIAAAWLVVEKMWRDGLSGALPLDRFDVWRGKIADMRPETRSATDVAFLVCRAAIKAVGG